MSKNVNVELLKTVNKENVTRTILNIMRSGRFHVFTIANCPECDKKNLNVLVGYSKNGSDAYYVCRNCGKRYAKHICIFGDEEQKGMRLKQYFAKQFYHKETDTVYFGIVVSKTRALLVLGNTYKVVDPAEYQISEVSNGVPGSGDKRGPTWRNFSGLA